MFSEIEKLLDTTSDLIPVFDEAAAVKYITWNDNQWVSVRVSCVFVVHWILTLCASTTMLRHCR